MSMIEQNLGGRSEDSTDPVDSARTKLLMEAVENRFADIDLDNSNTLDKNELLSAFQSNDYSDFGDGLAMLMNNFDAASSFASDENKTPFTGNKPGTVAFVSIFGSDKTADGISLKDLDAIELVASSASDTKSFLENIRGAEVAGGWKEVGWGLLSGAVGAIGVSAPTGISQFFGALNLGIAGIRAWNAYDHFANSDVPKFGEYIQGKRATLRSWQS